MITEFEITRPDDWHVHFRDDAMMAAVVPETSRHFGRAIVMPNLVPPVVTLEDAVSYAKRLKSVLPAGDEFLPLMTLYLTDTTDPNDVERARASLPSDPPRNSGPPRPGADSAWGEVAEGYGNTDGW